MKEDMQGYLCKRLGDKQGNEIYELVQKKKDELVKKIKDKSPSQVKTLTNVILPRIAMYQVLKTRFDIETTHDIVHGLVSVLRGTNMHNGFLKMEKLPFFYQIFRTAFIKNMSSSDLWVSEIPAYTKDAFRVNVHKCLWYNACVENNCPEMCRHFCECDNFSFGNLNKLELKRTKTLGMGGDYCDFCFVKK